MNPGQNMVKPSLLGATALLWLALLAGHARAAVSADSGQAADQFAPIAAAGGRDWWAGGWVRLRGMSGLPAPTAAEDPRYQGLAALRQLGVNPVVFFAPGGRLWFRGSRLTGGRPSYPVDLGEAYSYAERLAIDAWPNVAAWEIDNEPDLFWTADNAGTYAAYLKAVALGLRAGAREAAEAATGPGPRDPRAHAPAPALPLILPGALAMTPGPYLEQLAANDFLSYIDGFNWHFYGYAGDFTGQYHQFETAVGELAAARAAAPGRGRLEAKALPVFLTEYGYSQLSPAAAATVEGRVRQWRWFKSVTEQMQALRVAGPMAFYLPPLFDGNLCEFGLTMRPGSMAFNPADFGAAQAAPWMAGIGTPVGGGEATPALAWLAAQPAPNRTRDWPVKVPAPSPVVMDFLPDDNLQTMKSWHGYLLKPGTGALRTGGGELRIYNFSAETLTGHLTVNAPAGLMTALGTGEATLTLAPWELVHVPVGFRLTADGLGAFPWEVGFVADRGQAPPAVFATKLYPNASTMTKEIAHRFDEPAANAAAAATTAANRRLLLDRPLAEEEPRLHPRGRWLVSDGMEVEEGAGGWRFNVTAMPAQPLRPAMAELPLPDDFDFPAAHLLLFDYQLAAAPGGTATMDFDCYFRTANGNLFEVLPRLTATAAWQNYAEAKENFTGMSYGRMNLPWRFADNRPVALVFFLRPKTLPVTLEVRAVELARFRL
jgi:hypothetical protein